MSTPNDFSGSNQMMPGQTTSLSDQCQYFYSFDPNKLFWLNLITLGTYNILWFYRFWRHFKRRALAGFEDGYPKNKDILPFWPAIFTWYIVGTARRIQKRLNSHSSSSPRVRPWMSFWIFFIAIHLASEATEKYSPLHGYPIMALTVIIMLQAFASFVLYRLQKLANLANSAEGLTTNATGAESRPRKADWVFIGVGLISTCYTFAAILTNKFS